MATKWEVWESSQHTGHGPTALAGITEFNTEEEAKTHADEINAQNGRWAYIKRVDT